MASTASKWSAKKGGRPVRADVHVVGMVCSRGKSAGKYNRYLKAHMPGKTGYTGLCGCLSGSNGGYLRDDLHYNAKTIGKVLDRVL